jgi:hypothetical protein
MEVAVAETPIVNVFMDIRRAQSLRNDLEIFIIIYSQVK